MKRLVPILAFILVAGCQSEASPDSVQIENAWVRLPAISGRPAAAYFTVRGGRVDDELLEVSSPEAGRVELHDSRAHDGMTRMVPLASVAVPAGGEAEFASGSKHAMIFDLAPSIRPLQRMRLRFRFRSGEVREADVVAMATGMPEPRFVDAPAPAVETDECTPELRRDGAEITIVNC